MKQTSKFISSNFSVSLLIFLAGFTLLLVQHYLFLQQTKKLKLQTENQHGRIMLGEMISNDLNKIETCFFNLKVRDLFGRMVLILTSRIDIFKEASFDLIVSNPPYIPTRILSRLPLRVRYEPRVAIDGGDDGLVVVEEILTVATDLLRSGGLLALEIDPLISPKVRDLSSAFDFKIYKDYRGQDRYLIGVR